MGPIEALTIALSKEKASIELYNKFYLKHPVIKDTFSFLINEEQKHKQLIENKIAELTSK